jgi:hypothetical protein
VANHERFVGQVRGAGSCDRRAHGRTRVPTLDTENFPKTEKTCCHNPFYSEIIPRVLMTHPMKSCDVGLNCILRQIENGAYYVSL